MAIKIDETRMVRENSELYEERIHTPLRRFSDKTFTPTRYWHIKGDETVLDGGWGHSSGTVGPNSSLRYVAIDNLPLCGIETILPQLQSGDSGLDTTYEGEASTMDGTIRPLENDYFMITYLKAPWIFRVTAVEYDNLVSNAVFKIKFVLEYIDSTKVEELMRQTVEEYACIIENIGTDERCILRKSDMDRVSKITEMYDQIADTYKNLYYNERYNCFLGDFENGMKLYDPLQAEFINRHRLFTAKNQIDGVVLSDQFKDPKRDFKYQRSIYRFVELRRMDYLSTFGYMVFPGKSNPQTAFCKWLDSSVMILDMPRTMVCPNYFILSEEYVAAVTNNTETSSEQAELIKRFVRSEELDVSDISLHLHDYILRSADENLEIFFMTPIIMYIIRQIIHDRLKKVDHEDFLTHLA